MRWPEPTGHRTSVGTRDEILGRVELIGGRPQLATAARR